MALYWVLGAAWVAAGDLLLAYCVTEPQQLAYWQTLKGWLYVLLTGALAWWLLARMSRGQREIGAARADLLHSEACCAWRWKAAAAACGTGTCCAAAPPIRPVWCACCATRAPSCRAA